MRHQIRLSHCAAIIILLVVFVAPASAFAQKSPAGRVQEFTGTVNDSAEVILFDLRGLQAGQTLYAYVAATSGNLDTYLGLGSSDFEHVLREDDDSGGNYNSALQYTIQEAGDYRLAVTRYDESSSGGFHLLVGIDAPDVLNGRAQPHGEPFAALYGTTSRDSIRLNGMGLNFTDCSVLEERPQLSGPEETRGTQHFVLHFTTRGVDAANTAYVDTVASTLDTVWQREIDDLGWPAPPADCGEGGDTRYDVYLMDLLTDSDALGYTSPDALRGDNPSTVAIEEWAAYSHIVLDNDYQGYDNITPLMRTTAAHEFHHAIQFGFDISDESQWLYEATATWMETQVFPDDEEASPYVEDLFATPDLCIGAEPADERYSARIYAEWLLIDSLAQDYGPEVVHRLWDLVAVDDGMASIYQLADELGTTPQRIVQRFAVRNLLQDYALARRFNARVRVEALAENTGQIVPRQSGVEELGVDYVLVTRPGIYEFEITQPNLAMTVVGVNSKVGQAYIFDLGKRGVIDTTPFQYTYIILLNVDVAADSNHCTMTSWTLTVRDGNGQPLSDAEPKLWQTPNFLAAR